MVDTENTHDGVFPAFFYAAIIVHVLDVINGFNRSGRYAMVFFLAYGTIAFLKWMITHGDPKTKTINAVGMWVTGWAVPFFMNWFLPNVFFRVVGINAATYLLRITFFAMIFPLFIVLFVLNDPRVTQSRFTKWPLDIWQLLVFGYFLVIIAPLVLSATGDLSTQYKAPIRASWNSGIATIKNGATMLKDTIVSIPSMIKGGIDNQIVMATGDYYGGSVENTRTEPVGVYLEDVKASSPKYYKGDTVSVWGTIRGKTFDKPINVAITCSAKDPAGTIYTADEIRPAPPFAINEFVDAAPMLCSFGKGKLPPERYTITIGLDFNLETLGYIRTYLMRADQLLAKQKELHDNGKDYSGAGVLSSYGLPAHPTAYFTNGPVGVGIGTTDPPLRIEDPPVISPYMGVAIDNKWGRGNIKEITSLYMLVPKPITLDSCGDDTFTLVASDPNRDEENYNKYALNIGSTHPIKIRDLTSFSSFRCFMNVGTDALDNTPEPTIRTLKASAEYVFHMESSVSVNIKDDGVVTV